MLAALSTTDEAKKAAARAAIGELPEQGLVGLGSGSTSRIFVEELAPHVKAGRRLVGESKLSSRLGEKWPVPIEVLGFAHGATRAHLEKLGQPVLRMKGGAAVRTDAGNLIYDLATGPIQDPGALDRALRAIPGVVETGLFVGRADVVLVAGERGVTRLVR